MSDTSTPSNHPVEAPASALRGSFPQVKAPSEDVPGMPYNFGEGVLPHVVTFQGLVSSVSRVYRYYDEAMKASHENARFMRNDLTVMEPVEQRRRACALLNWHLEVDDPEDRVQKQLAADLTMVLKQIPNFLKFREVLLDAVWYGKNAVQFSLGWKKCHGAAPVSAMGQNMVIQAWKPLHGDKLVFRYDDGTRQYDPNQVGIRVGAGYTMADKGVANRMDRGGQRKIEACDYGLAYFLEPWERKLLAIHKHMIEDGEYEDPQSAGKIHGLGIRSRIYWTWYLKQECFAHLMEFLERSSNGIEIWYYPWGNPDAKALVEQAAKERIGNSRNVILMPRPVGEDAQAFGIEMVQPNIAGIDALRTLVDDYLGNLVMRYVLGQTMTNKPQSAGLGSDLPQIQLGSYLQIIRYDAINLGETMTTDVVDFLKLVNYPHLADIPCRFVVDTESEDIESKLNAWKMAYEVGVKTKAGDWLKMIGAAKPEENDEIIQNPITQQQDRLYQQWLEHKKQAEAMGMTPPGSPQPGEAPPAQAGQDAAREETDPADIAAATLEAAGEPQQPAKYSLREDIEAAAAVTDLNPTDDQKTAGNYRKGKVRIHGLEIAIENPKGSTRSGTGHDGKPWSITMANHYGYVKMHESEADGDHVDVFLGPDPKSEVAFVVNQTKGPTWTHFDEHKVMLGWHTAEAAKKAYLEKYSPGWKGFDSIVAMTIDQLKDWLDDGSTAERAVEQYAKKAAPGQRSLFEEEKHPRGQPENAGQFASKGYTSGSNPKPVEDALADGKPAAPKVADEPPAVKSYGKAGPNLKDRKARDEWIASLEQAGEKISEAAFLHNGRIYRSGGYHTKKLAATGAVAGFVTDRGNFITREEAGLLLEGRRRMMTSEVLHKDKSLSLAGYFHSDYSLCSDAANPVYGQLLACYYKASSDEVQQRFWDGDEREIVVIQDGKPMRYCRRNGQISAAYVYNEAN